MAPFITTTRIRRHAGIPSKDAHLFGMSVLHDSFSTAPTLLCQYQTLSSPVYLCQYSESRSRQHHPVMYVHQGVGHSTPPPALALARPRTCVSIVAAEARSPV
jgi:hypothetical protein